MALLITDFFVHRDVGMAWPSSQLGQSTIRNDRGKPGRYLRRPFELIQVLVGRQEGILHRVFSVVWVSDIAICSFVKERHISRNNILKFPNALYANLDCGVMLISNVRRSRSHVVYASAVDVVKSTQHANRLGLGYLCSFSDIHQSEERIDLAESASCVRHLTRRPHSDRLGQ
jgi:hypothetical protein